MSPKTERKEEGRLVRDDAHTVGRFTIHRKTFDFSDGNFYQRMMIAENTPNEQTQADLAYNPKSRFRRYSDVDSNEHIICDRAWKLVTPRTDFKTVLQAADDQWEAQKAGLKKALTFIKKYARAKGIDQRDLPEMETEALKVIGSTLVATHLKAHDIRRGEFKAHNWVINTAQMAENIEHVDIPKFSKKIHKCDPFEIRIQEVKSRASGLAGDYQEALHVPSAVEADEEFQKHDREERIKLAHKFDIQAVNFFNTSYKIWLDAAASVRADKPIQPSEELLKKLHKHIYLFREALDKVKEEARSEGTAFELQGILDDADALAEEMEDIRKTAASPDAMRKAITGGRRR